MGTSKTGSRRAVVGTGHGSIFPAEQIKNQVFYDKDTGHNTAAKLRPPCSFHNRRPRPRRHEVAAVFAHAPTKKNGRNPDRGGRQATLPEPDIISKEDPETPQRRSQETSRAPILKCGSLVMHLVFADLFPYSQIPNDSSILRSPSLCPFSPRRMLLFPHCR